MQLSVRSLFRQTPADGTEVTVSGWVRTVRDSKAFAFIALNDGTFFQSVQIVCEQNLSNFADVVKTTLGSAIEVTGTLVLTPGAQQPFEIKAEKVEMVGPCDPSYPMQKKRHTVEYLRTQAHLRPRTNLFSAVFRIRSIAAQSIHAFFAERNFVYVHTPLITTSDAEGAGEMFRVTTLDLNNVPK
ncbi:MAG: asparagine--tRNA ligase, partial [Clostridia bacterium]|nr:asparagine--tRNA ligase [Clostridia bacterium]